MNSKISIIILFLITLNTYSQNVNWRNLNPDQSHLLNVSFSFDYGTSLGLGYGYKLPTKFPIVLNTEFSSPFGEKFLDDFKTKLGGQVEVIHINEFSTTIKAYSIFRRFENDLTRLLNFGSEVTIVSGYYKSKWYVAGELGFDKAITTHIKHSNVLRDYFPDAKDGWYIPTGGNFSFGIQTGYSFGSNEFNLKVGKVIEQDFKTNPSIPFYFHIGVIKKI